MNIAIDDELEKRLKQTIFERKGMKKGNISQAIEEAIEAWIAKPQATPYPRY